MTTKQWAELQRQADVLEKEKQRKENLKDIPEISDEEIEKAAKEKFLSTLKIILFSEGAKWYREQLKQRK